MTIRCKNEDGYGNVTYVEYEVFELVEAEEEATLEDIIAAMEELA